MNCRFPTPRQTGSWTSALVEAGEKPAETVKAADATLLDVRPDEVELADGRVRDAPLCPGIELAARRTRWCGYVRPSRLSDAIAELAETRGGGKVIAGGQSLTPVLALRLARPDTLIDINSVEELGALNRSGPALHIGATVTQRRVERDPLGAGVPPELPRTPSPKPTSGQAPSGPVKTPRALSTSNPTLGMAAVFGSFAVTVVMRPAGGALFGEVADRRGRKMAMVVVMSGVGPTTAASDGNRPPRPWTCRRVWWRIS
ncbi:FAD binding domain-containing protein [Streptomyces sp. OE57]|uniref:FAD binding domain-containing protein n=1 Tax=Streptomyces lacaronensis TaxID=3379885 RepID=UPI0039B75547